MLPEAIQDLETWMSEHDIAAGARWGHELTSQLADNRIGIICLTPENLVAPWLLFEAGALAKSITESRVVPYRLMLSAADVPFPLAQFQGVDADESGTLKLLASLNLVREHPMPDDRLERVFSRWWPDLANRLAAIPAPANLPQKPRADRALLEEILQLVRRQQSPLPAEAVLGEVLQIVRGLPAQNAEQQGSEKDNQQYYPIDDRISLYKFLKKRVQLPLYREASMPALFEAAAEFIASLEPNLTKDEGLMAVARYLVSERPLKSLLDGLASRTAENPI